MPRHAKFQKICRECKLFRNILDLTYLNVYVTLKVSEQERVVRHNRCVVVMDTIVHDREASHGW
jgi:hypothetical protein